MAVTNGINGVNGTNGTHTTNGTTNGVNGHGQDSAELWRHPRPETTEFYAFQQHLMKKYPIRSDSYTDLWKWSIDNPADFWEEIWHYTGIKAHKTYDSVCQQQSKPHPGTHRLIEHATHVGP
jgi:acetoacetyl-CoA synthetase